MPGTAGTAEQIVDRRKGLAQGRPRLTANRVELMRLVEEGSRDFARARQLVDALVAEQVPFEESLLGGGPWQARLVAVEAAPCLNTLHVLAPRLTPLLNSKLCHNTQVVFSSGPLLWQAWTALGDVLTPRRLGRSSNKVPVAPADLLAICVSL